MKVQCAADGFEGLTALKQSLPDIIISDLRMPNMNGFEFLSVVRRRLPSNPVIVISGEFTGVSVPESVLADAFFSKGAYQLSQLFQRIVELLEELLTRQRTGRPTRTSVWVKKDKGLIAVTCAECLRTFPVVNVTSGVNETECDFCSCKVKFEAIGESAIRLSAKGPSVLASPATTAERL